MTGVSRIIGEFKAGKSGIIGEFMTELNRIIGELLAGASEIIAEFSWQKKKKVKLLASSWQE